MGTRRTPAMGTRRTPAMGTRRTPTMGTRRTPAIRQAVGNKKALDYRETGGLLSG